MSFVNTDMQEKLKPITDWSAIIDVIDVNFCVVMLVMF